ncbi:hypothetical protein BJ878DRAFT_479187 [Calycina marina]|uniref:Uncharacterized protein n=1 Tax=Calycina marina TaxID=1763456 RepID=A0A9P8CGA3_9HELO|nr:hypothetical protein BJ878DRAFT_479187 [Calycina marina]
MVGIPRYDAEHIYDILAAHIPSNKKMDWKALAARMNECHGTWGRGEVFTALGVKYVHDNYKMKRHHYYHPWQAAYQPPGSVMVTEIPRKYKPEQSQQHPVVISTMEDSQQLTPPKENSSALQNGRRRPNNQHHGSVSRARNLINSAGRGYQNNTQNLRQPPQTNMLGDHAPGHFHVPQHRGFLGQNQNLMLTQQSSGVQSHMNSNVGGFSHPYTHNKQSRDPLPVATRDGLNASHFDQMKPLQYANSPIPTQQSQRHTEAANHQPQPQPSPHGLPKTPTLMELVRVTNQALDPAAASSQNNFFSQQARSIQRAIGSSPTIQQQQRQQQSSSAPPHQQKANKDLTDVKGVLVEIPSIDAINTAANGIKNALGAFRAAVKEGKPIPEHAWEIISQLIEKAQVNGQHPHQSMNGELVCYLKEVVKYKNDCQAAKQLTMTQPHLQEQHDSGKASNNIIFGHPKQVCSMASDGDHQGCSEHDHDYNIDLFKFHPPLPLQIFDPGSFMPQHMYPGHAVAPALSQTNNANNFGLFRPFPFNDHFTEYYQQPYGSLIPDEQPNYTSGIQDTAAAVTLPLNTLEQRERDASPGLQTPREYKRTHMRNSSSTSNNSLKYKVACQATVNREPVRQGIMGMSSAAALRSFSHVEYNNGSFHNIQAFKSLGEGANGYQTPSATFQGGGVLREQEREVTTCKDGADSVQKAGNSTGYVANADQHTTGADHGNKDVDGVTGQNAVHDAAYSAQQAVSASDNGLLGVLAPLTTEPSANEGDDSARMQVHSTTEEAQDAKDGEKQHSPAASTSPQEFNLEEYFSMT